MAARVDYDPAGGHSLGGTPPFEQRRGNDQLSKGEQEVSNENKQNREASGSMRGVRGSTCYAPSLGRTAPKR